MCVVGVHVEGLTYSSRTGVRTYVYTSTDHHIYTRASLKAVLTPNPPALACGMWKARECMGESGEVTPVTVVSRGGWF